MTTHENKSIRYRIQCRLIFAGMFILSLLFSPSALSGTLEGVVTDVYVHGYDDLVVFRLDAAYASAPACNTSVRFAVSTNTQQGKNILSTVIYAKASNQTMYVLGTDTCTVLNGAENVRWILVK